MNKLILALLADAAMIGIWFSENWYLTFGLIATMFTINYINTYKVK